MQNEFSVVYQRYSILDVLFCHLAICNIQNYRFCNAAVKLNSQQLLAGTVFALDPLIPASPDTDTSPVAATAAPRPRGREAPVCGL